MSQLRSTQRDVVSDARQELLEIGGPGASKRVRDFERASRAFDAGRDRDVVGLLRPIADVAPDAPSVRELLGLAHYRLGNYRAAVKELEAYRALTKSVDENPVLMDCYRAQRRWKKVDELWRDLGDVSPAAAVVTEGRIVAAGALADRGRVGDGIALLRKKADGTRRPQDHHLRLWYALADLEERAGDLPAARARFERIRKAAPDFADVGTRIRALR